MLTTWISSHHLLVLQTLLQVLRMLKEVMLELVLVLQAFSMYYQTIVIPLIDGLLMHVIYRTVNLRKNDYAAYTYIINIAVEVPVPKRVSGFDQILLPLQPEVWLTFGMVQSFSILKV